MKGLDTQSTQETRKQNRKTCFIVNWKVLHFCNMEIARMKFENPAGRGLWVWKHPLARRSPYKEKQLHQHDGLSITE